MIGILLSSYEREIVEEFFQLFKTPWELFIPGHCYDVVITDLSNVSGLVAALIISFERPENDPINARESEQTSNIRVTLLETGGMVFPVYLGARRISGGEPLVRIQGTREWVGSRFCTSTGHILRLGFNLFEEIKYLLTCGQPLAYASYATVEMHIAGLRGWMLDAGVGLVEIPPVPRGNRFFACLTHDVDFASLKHHKFDHTMYGFLYRGIISSAIRFLRGAYPLKYLFQNWLAALSLPLVHLGILDDFWAQFRKYVEVENKSGSTFFFVPFRNTPGMSTDGSAPTIRAVKYDLRDLKADIDYLLQNNCEIGVHGIDGWISPDKGREELSRLKELTEDPEIGIRTHWLYFMPESPLVLEKAGYSYDSSLGYNETIGYRTGTIQVYKPPGAQTLLELPLHVMDTALFYPDRMNLSLTEGLEIIRKLSRASFEYGGVLTFNWHDRSMAPERLWGDVYIQVLEELREQGARLSRAGSVVGWFRKRREVRFGRVTRDGSFLSVEFEGEPPGGPDDLLLRIYRPPCGRADLNSLKTRASVYEDYPLAGEKKVVVCSAC